MNLEGLFIVAVVKSTFFSNCQLKFCWHFTFFSLQEIDEALLLVTVSITITGEFNILYLLHISANVPNYCCAVKVSRLLLPMSGVGPLSCPQTGIIRINIKYYNSVTNWATIDYNVVVKNCRSLNRNWI